MTGKRWVIVPARAGSQRLLRKNTRVLAGKPLICHTLDTIEPFFDKIIVTSDDEDVLALETTYNSGKFIFDKRPEHLCTNTSKVIFTVQHYVKKHHSSWFGQKTNNTKLYNGDQIWLALTTCPLRSADDVKSAQAYLTRDVDSVISVTDFEFPPQLSLMEDSQGHLIDVNLAMPFAQNNTRSQDFGRHLRPNGALYGAWVTSFRDKKNFFLGKTRAYYIPRERSVDIDTQMDFDIAEMMLKKRDKNDSI